jgi:hypothetical protein
VTLLRESFSAVNARFHLVGFYALVALLVRFAQHWTGDDPSGLPLMLGALLLYIAADSGVFGLLFQAAMGSRQPLSFLRWAVALFLPILWLLFKIGLLQAWLIALVATLYQVSSGRTLGGSLEAVLYWGRPFFDLVTQVLALYSMPLCILSRVRREWRPHIRQGFGLFRACPSESRRLLLLVGAVTALESALHFAMGSGDEKAPPGYPEGLVTLASAYLSLIAFFGATRVVLARFATGSPEAVPGAGAAAPGPET